MSHKLPIGIFNKGTPHPASKPNWDDNLVYKEYEEIPKFMSDSESMGFYTPDLPALMKRDNHLVFVYGTLRKGFHNNSLLHNSEFIGYGGTTNHYVMFKTINTKQSYPVVFLNSSAEKAGSIFGELYRVDAHTIRELDYLESNGTMYQRWLTAIYVANPDGTTSKTYAHMYKGIRKFWASRKDSVERVKPYIPNAATHLRYYMFNKE